MLHVLQLGYHTPHKISASSGFKAFLCSTLAFFIVAMASHLQLCSIEDFGKCPYSFLQCYICAVTQGKKNLFSGNCQVGCCLLHVLQLGYHTLILHIKYLHPLVSKPFCAVPLPSSLLPWRLICNSVRLRILGNVHALFCNATPVPWRRVKKAYSVGIVKSAAACCTYFSLVIILHIKYLHPLVSKPFCTVPLPSSLLPWCLICNSVRLRILGNVHTLFCIATPVPWRG